MSSPAESAPLAAARRLPPQPWLDAPATRRVVAALTAGGAQVRFVGGCVRDALLGRAVKDIDLATHDPPETAMRLLRAAGINAVPTGIDHGTVTAVIGREHFEITTLRIDVETDGRRAKVAFTDDWTADAARRDFTINAISAAPDGTLHDPFGGLADLAAGRVRFVGDARARIREDVLRLLRFFRFHAHYGRCEADAEALAACRALAPLLPALSGERVAGETLKLMTAATVAEAVELTIAQDVLRYVLPEAGGTAALRALVAIEAMLALAPGALRRLAALIEADAEGVRAVAIRLRLSNQQRDRLVGLVAPALPLDANASAAERRRILRRAGRALYVDLVLVTWARARARPENGSPDAIDAAFRAALATADDTVPAFPLKGRDALELGLPAGPAVGRLLAEVEAWWEAGDYRATRAECLDRLRALAQG